VSDARHAARAACAPRAAGGARAGGACAGGAAWRLLLVAAALLAPGVTAGQVLPPIYRPIPSEEQARIRTQLGQWRDSAAMRERRADSLGTIARRVPEVRALVEELRGRAALLRATANTGRDEALRARAAARLLAASADSLAAASARRRAWRDRIAVDSGPLLLALPLVVPGSAVVAALGEVQVPLPAALRPSVVRALDASLARDAADVDALRAQADARRLAAERSQLEAARDDAEATRVAADAERLAQAGDERVVRATLEAQAAAEVAAGRRFARLADSLAPMLDSRQRLAERRWLPVRDVDDAQLYYGARGGRVGYLRGATATYDNRRGASANIDLVEYYVPLGRLSWTAVWNERGPSSDSAAARSALDRFLLGGGDLALTFMAPLVFQRGEGWSLALAGDVRGAMSLGPQGRFPLGDTGLILYGGGSQRLLGEVTFAARAGLIRHGDDIVGAITGTAAAIPYGQFTAGWQLHNLLKVVVTTTTGPGVVRRELAYTIQFKI
jgi:hypothetical protein